MIYQPTTSDGLRITAFVRDDVPVLTRPRQNEIAIRLDRLQQAGTVTASDVVEWGRRVSLEDGLGPQDGLALATYARFAAWAHRADASLDPFFQTRTCYCWQTCDRYEALVLPVVSLAVHEAGALRAVYPHRVEETVYTVREFLSQLETEDPDRQRPQQQLIQAGD
jgi:hypothetical protein